MQTIRKLAFRVAAINDLKDPTGCGDAYRSGLLYGLMNNMDWETTGRLAAIMGACKIEVNGTQNHAPTRDEIGERFKQNFDICPGTLVCGNLLSVQQRWICFVQ